MATAGSEVTTTRVRPPAQSNYSCSIEDISLEEAFHPRDAVPSPPLTHPPMSLRMCTDHRGVSKLKDHILSCGNCQNISKDLCHPMHRNVLSFVAPIPRPDATAMANEAIGMEVEPSRDSTYFRSHPSRLVGNSMAISEHSWVHMLCGGIASCSLDDRLLDCQTCLDIVEELGHPMQRLGSPSTISSSRPEQEILKKHTEIQNPKDGVATESEETAAAKTLQRTYRAHRARRELRGLSLDPASRWIEQSRHHASLLPNTKTAGCFGYITSIPWKVCHRWLGSFLLGLSSLTLAIVSLLMYTIRSYRMAVWTTRNDELQACTGLIQAGRPIGLNCERLISEGPQDPPYNLSKRMTNSGGPGSFFNLSDISLVGTDMSLPVETEHSAWLIFASIFALISLADLLLNLLRQRSTTKDYFESLAAVEIATLPYQGQSSTIIDGGHLDTWYPGMHTDRSVGIRRRIRPRQEVQNEISIEDQSVGEEGLPYSMARYLSQPLRNGGIGEMPISFME
ncbi:hypothetical protein JMJ35_004032 [Cladonia borealis]|uniref:Uncharacterized protein n=1 Tax=Cladonia borealis TaxID=184061 RepID=A0AA39R5F8_9LECA|nr:hypothetical protein JMJ35_004032 [Cladonia borealis]